MELTEEQLKIVLSDEKINLALATPGSGKSTVLAERARRLYNDFNEPILICTFTNEAVNSVSRKLGDNYINHIKVQTIHSLAFNIVKEFWVVLGNIMGGPDWPIEPHITCKEEEIVLIQELFPRTDYEKMYGSFQDLRKFGISCTDLLRMYKLGAYLGKSTNQDIENFNKFDKYRLSKGLIHFDDMIDLCNIIMPFPEVTIQLCKRYAHILVDEAQDTSKSQWAILRPLIAHCKTTLLVSDPNQNIFSFRGADCSLLHDFGSLKDSLTFRLTQSFRSGEEIAQIANKVVWDKTSQIKTQKRKSTVKVKKFKTREDEIDCVLKQIDEESVILSRTNAYLEQFEQECIKRGISYQGSGFYRSKHVRTLYEFIRDYTGSDIEKMIEQAFLENSKYEKIQKEDFKIVIRLLKEKGSEYFLSLINKSAVMNNSGVTLMTCHSSKGLEWDRVFCVGMQDGHIPHKLSTNEEEESKLFYVAITRPRNFLYISYIGQPSRFIPEEYL